MNIYPFYYSTSSFNQFLLSTTSSDYWIQHMSINNTSSSFHHQTPKKRKYDEFSIDQENQELHKKRTITTINHFQNDLDHLFYEWNTINIVLESVRNAFTIKHDLSEEHLDEVDRELSIAYDDLMSQVRHLERQLKRMTNEIHQKLIVQQPQQQQQQHQPQQWDRRPLTPTPNKAFWFGVTSTHNK